MSQVKNVGEKVRKIRESRNLSQEELAEKSKLSKELIAKIEESNDLPFLAPLVRISRTLGVRLGTLLDEAREPGPVIARGSNKEAGFGFSHRDSLDSSNLSFLPLASDKNGRHMEPFLIDILPTEDSEFSFSSHEGEEFLYVLAGEVELSYGSDVFKISEGDSIYYDSLVKHHVHTANDKPARILAVVYAPY
jgi:transcriptional regulator with XRE-family HTH domain